MSIYKQVLAFIGVNQSRFDIQGENTRTNSVRQTGENAQVGALRIQFQPIDSIQTDSFQDGSKSCRGRRRCAFDGEKIMKMIISESFSVGLERARAERRFRQIEADRTERSIACNCFIHDDLLVELA